MPKEIKTEEAQKKVRELRKTLRKYQAEKDKLEAEIYRCQQERAKKEQSWAREEVVVKRELENNQRPLLSKLANLRKRQLALEKDLKKNSSGRVEQSKLRAQQVKRLSIQQALREAKQDLIKSQRQYKDLLLAVAQLQKKLRSLEVDFPRQLAALERKEKNNPLEKRLQNLDRSLARLFSLRRLNQEAEDRVTRQISGCRDDEAERRLKTELRWIKQKGEAQQREIKNLQEEKDRLERDLKRVTIAAQVEKDNLKRQHDQDLDNGKSKLSQWQTQLAELKQKMEEQKRLIAKLRKQDDSLGRTIAILEKEWLDKERKVKEATRARQRIAAEIKLIQQQEERLQKEAATKLKRLADRRQSLKQAEERDVAAKQRKINQINQKINHLKIEATKALDYFWQAVHQELEHEEKN